MLSPRFHKKSQPECLLRTSSHSYILIVPTRPGCYSLGLPFYYSESLQYIAPPVHSVSLQYIAARSKFFREWIHGRDSGSSFSRQHERILFPQRRVRFVSTRGRSHLVIWIRSFVPAIERYEDELRSPSNTAAVCKMSRLHITRVSTVDNLLTRRRESYCRYVSTTVHSGGHFADVAFHQTERSA